MLESNYRSRAKILEIGGTVDEAELPKLLFEDLSEQEIREIHEFDDDDGEANVAERESENDEAIIEERPQSACGTR